MNKVISWIILYSSILGVTQAGAMENWNPLRCKQSCTASSCKNPQILKTCKIKCAGLSTQLGGCFSSISTTPQRSVPKAAAPKPRTPNLLAQKNPRALHPTPQVQPIPKVKAKPVKNIGLASHSPAVIAKKPVASKPLKPKVVKSQPRPLRAVPRPRPTPFTSIRIEDPKVDCQNASNVTAECFNNGQPAFPPPVGEIFEPGALEFDVQMPSAPMVKNPHHQALFDQLQSFQEQIEQKLVVYSSPDPTTLSYLEFLKFYVATVQKFIQIYNVCTEDSYKAIFGNDWFTLNLLTKGEEKLDTIMDELISLWEKGASQPSIDMGLYKITKDYWKNNFFALLWAIDGTSPYLIKAGIDREDLINPFDRFLSELNFRDNPFDWEQAERKGLGKNKPFRVYQGFKIHISAESAFADQIFKAVLPLLKDYHWKFAGSSAFLDYINAHYLDQRGKFITIYPSDDEASLKIAKILDPVLSQFPNHYFVNIPNDRPLGNSGGLFTRYGAYEGDTIHIIENGETMDIKDDRQGPWKHPSIPDIFEQDFPLYN